MISLSLSLCSHLLHADQEVTTDDGREVLLKEDGSWTFRSTDRFANTVDGQRIRLKQDGSWAYVGNSPDGFKRSDKDHGTGHHAAENSPRKT
jgi:hypothetical protein